MGKREGEEPWLQGTCPCWVQRPAPERGTLTREDSLGRCWEGGFLGLLRSPREEPGLRAATLHPGAAAPFPLKTWPKAVGAETQTWSLTSPAFQGGMND